MAIAVGIFLAGCIDMAPAYHRPPQPVPAQFPTGASYPATTGQPIAAIVGWRDFFSDPRLKSAIETALANNRDLRIAVANIAEARAQYHVQRAALLPSLDAQLGATIGQEPLSVLGGGGALSGATGKFDEHVYSAELTVPAWQLDLFGKIKNLTRAAQDQYFASRQARDAAQITLVSEVAGDWLTYGADQALIKIARDTLVSGKISLDLTRHRLTAGVASQLDVSQADIIVEQARFDIARLTTQVAQDRNALELVVGAPVPDSILPDSLVSDPVVLERLPQAVSSTVLLQRPDIAQAEDQLRAANANIGAARAAFFPDITLTGSGGLISTALSSLIRSSATAWSFAPTVTQPIFDGGLNLGNLAYATAARDAGVAQYEKSIQTAFREVADALADRGTIAERLSAQKALTATDAQFLQLSTARYEQGADTYLNTLIAQRSYFAAQETQVAAELTYSLNLVALYTTLGGGLDTPPDVVSINRR
jgi:multidrug efflux system outer membrane protein